MQTRVSRDHRIVIGRSSEPSARRRYRCVTCVVTLMALLALVVPGPAECAGLGGQLDGLLVGVDGRPAAGYRVHLIDPQGNDVAQSSADERGVYSFQDLSAGRYSLGIENPQGQMAPVAGPPVQMASGQLARRDVKLVHTDPAGQQATTRANFGIGLWWHGLSKPARAWTIVGLVAIVGITIVALTDDNDDSEPPASPF